MSVGFAGTRRRKLFQLMPQQDDFGFQACPRLERRDDMAGLQIQETHMPRLRTAATNSPTLPSGVSTSHGTSPGMKRKMINECSRSGGMEPRIETTFRGFETKTTIRRSAVSSLKGVFMRFRSALTKSNDTIALKMTIAFGSIWCVYAFAVFSLVPLLAPSVENTLLYISNCIQLIALPALMVGSAILARSSDQRARNDHDALLEILKDVHEELAILKQTMPGVAQELDTEREGKSRAPNP